jgi:predicted O-methyltransferase YrrM
MATVDMRELVDRLGDRPCDPPSRQFETEAQFVRGCATPPLGGRLLYGVVRTVRPRTVVEIGTAHGYGTYYIASALAANGAGHLRTLERRRVAVELAKEAVGRLRVAERVTVVEGDFRDTLPRALDRPDVDLVFNDGDKSVDLTSSQFEQALAAIPGPGFLFFDDIDFNREIRALFAGFVAHPRVERATSFHGRWALLQLAAG